MESPLSPPEAFAAIALAAVACDGALDPHEATLLRAALEGRHPYRERSEESMGRMFEKLLDLLHAEGWRMLLHRAIPVLSARQRETALAMAAHLIYGDRQANADEMGMLGELALQAGLPEGRAEQILEVIAVLHQDTLEIQASASTGR
jgi:hypothetical protein